MLNFLLFLIYFPFLYHEIVFNIVLIFCIMYVIPTDIPRGFHVETTWCVCRDQIRWEWWKRIKTFCIFYYEKHISHPGLNLIFCLHVKNSLFHPGWKFRPCERGPGWNFTPLVTSIQYKKFLKRPKRVHPGENR